MVRYWIYLLNRTSFGYETWPTNRYSYIIMGNIITKHIAWFGGVGPKSRFFFLFSNLTNQKTIIMNYWNVLTSCTEKIKNKKKRKKRKKKEADLNILLFYQIHKRAWNYFPLSWIMVKLSWNFSVGNCTNIWPNLIPILTQILKKQSKM